MQPLRTKLLKIVLWKSYMVEINHYKCKGKQLIVVSQNLLNCQIEESLPKSDISVCLYQRTTVYMQFW